MRFLLAIFSLSLLLAAGCGGSGRPSTDLPPLNPAGGKVVRGGAPVSGGSIQFSPVAPTDANRDLFVSAEVGPDGSFSLSTVHAASQKKGEGAPSGEFNVVYTPPMGDQTKVSALDLTPVSLPSPFTVQYGANDLTIDLDAR